MQSWARRGGEAPHTTLTQLVPLMANPSRHEYTMISSHSRSPCPTPEERVLHDSPAQEPASQPTETAFGMAEQSWPSPADAQPPHDSSSFAKSMHSYAHSLPSKPGTELLSAPASSMSMWYTPSVQASGAVELVEIGEGLDRGDDVLLPSHEVALAAVAGVPAVSAAVAGLSGVAGRSTVGRVGLLGRFGAVAAAAFWVQRCLSRRVNRGWQRR